MGDSRLLTEYYCIGEIHHSADIHMRGTSPILTPSVRTACCTTFLFHRYARQYLRMCPDGSEGATYAALTTFSNIALNCAGSVGTLFAKVGATRVRAFSLEGGGGVDKERAQGILRRGARSWMALGEQKRGECAKFTFPSTNIG